MEIRLFYLRHPTEPYVRYLVSMGEEPEADEYWELDPNSMYRTLNMFPELFNWSPVH